jgi:hypothetical protein
MRKLTFPIVLAANVLLVASFFGGPDRMAKAAAQIVILNPVSGALTEWQQGVGFNFRNTQGFVTDNTGQLAGLGYADGYPKTRTPAGYSDSVTFGRGSGTESQANRDSGIDPRFAGSLFISNGGIQRAWQVDLPAGGDYEIRIAAGRTAGTAQGCVRFQVRDTDNSTVLVSCDPGSAIGNDNYLDASCTVRSEADWPSQNAAETVTFTGGSPTKFNFYLGGGSCASGVSDIAHLHIKQL